MKRVEAILYAATADEGHQLLIDAQHEFGQNGAVPDIAADTL